jgi:hypothetical protein
MRFILYSDKSVSECIKALNERVQGGGKFQGQVDKAKSQFSLTTSTKVLKRFARSTRLSATITREEGVTVIQGYVSEGMELGRWLLIFAVIMAAAVIFYVAGNAILGIMAALFGLWSYIPLTGDSDNSDTLLREVRRLLDAKETKPKPSSTSSGAKSPVTTRPSANPSPFGASRSSSPPSSPSNPTSSRPSSPSNPTSRYNPPRK